MTGSITLEQLETDPDPVLARFPGLALDPAHDVELRGFEFRGPTALWVLPDGSDR